MELRVENPKVEGAVRSDPGAVEQILFNLVDNACKYARPSEPAGAGVLVGETVGAITIRAFARDRRVVIEVRDGGPGVAADQTPRLFQPFSRSAEAAANSATRTPGVGLGLALSRRLARAMGGELSWVSAVKDGACFELTLPMA
ncbi:MAG TPA: ATP-binding protein, partial [Planctomycetota bacterium]|nr:ATP-binding protein [Planctomycetota bacterium]